MMTTQATRAEALDDTLSPLSLTRVGIDTYRENVADLHRDCDLYRAEGFQALSKVQAIIEAQGSNFFDPDDPPLAPHSFEVLAEAGAPKAAGAGVDLLRRIGEPVTTGQPLYRVHAAYRNELTFAHQSSERETGIAIGRAEEIIRLNVEF